MVLMVDGGVADDGEDDDSGLVKLSYIIIIIFIIV